VRVWPVISEGLNHRTTSSNKNIPVIRLYAAIKSFAYRKVCREVRILYVCIGELIWSNPTAAWPKAWVCGRTRAVISN